MCFWIRLASETFEVSLMQPFPDVSRSVNFVFLYRCPTGQSDQMWHQADPSAVRLLCVCKASW